MESVHSMNPAHASNSLGVWGGDVRSCRGVTSVTVVTRARNGERLRGSTSSSWSSCYPCLTRIRLNMLLIPASVLFIIITSILFLIPFISGKTKKGNIKPRSSLHFCCCCLDCAFCHGCAKCWYVFGSIAVLQSLLRRKAKLRK